MVVLQYEIYYSLLYCVSCCSSVPSGFNNKTEICYFVDPFACDPSLCSNNGDCIDLDASSSSDEQFVCSCDDGFTGDDCSTAINYCDSSPCLNGGSCSELPTTFSCDCARGWNGTTCDGEWRIVLFGDNQVFLTFAGFGRTKHYLNLDENGQND